MMDITERG